MKWFWQKPAPPQQVRATESGRVLAVTVQGQTVWALIDYESFASQGYSKNPIVYRCTRMICEMASATPWTLNGKPLDESTDKLALTLQQPSDTLSLPDLVDALAGSLVLAGEAFIEGVELRNELAEIAPMRPDFVKVVPAIDGTVSRYEFESGGGRKLFPVPLPGGVGARGFGAVCHIRMWHPTDQWRGHSPMLAATSSVLEHNGVGDYARALLKNAARPSGALVYAPKDGPSNMTDDQFERVKRELEEKHSGAENAGRPFILEGGLAWVPMSLTPVEMGSAEGRSASAREIALALGVPPLLLGLPGDNTYANYAEAQVALWRGTVKPMLGRITARMTRWVQPLHRGAVIAPDYANAPISEDERTKAFERVKGVDFLTVDEKRAMVGLPELPDSLGKVVLVGASLVRLEDVIDGAMADPAKAGKDAYGDTEADDEADDEAA